MLRTLFSTVVLSLAFWSGTAHAQVLTSTPGTVTLNYMKGSTTPTSTTSTITDDLTDGVPYTAVSADSWLTATPATSLAHTAGTGGDICTFALVTTVADHMAAGLYTSTVPIVGGATGTSVTV